MEGKLRRALAARWRVLYRIYWRPLVAVVAAVYLVIGIDSTLSGEFASARVQKMIRLGNFIPHLSAWIWAAIGLGLLLVLGIERAVREFRRIDRAHAAELTKERNTHRAALDALRQAHERELAEKVPASSHVPLEPRYGRSVRYQHQNGSMTVHRIGLYNPVGNPEAAGVRLDWMGMVPWPSFHSVHSEQRWQPAIPCAVPRVTGGDPNIGISLPPGQEALWMAVTTGITADGTMNAVEFGPPVSSCGNWHGLSWKLESGGQWRLTYRIVTDNLLPNTFTFSLVITAEDGEIECELQG